MNAPAQAVALWALALALVAGACSERTGEAVPDGAASPGQIAIVTGPDEPMPALEDLEGIVIDIVPGVDYELRISSATPGTTQRLATINRQPFELTDGYVRIGEHRFGPVHDGDHVSIRAEGVFLNGERVGDVPPKPAAAGSPPR